MDQPTQNLNENSRDQFAVQAAQPTAGFLFEFWDFVRSNKKWWITPIVVVLLLMGGLVMLAGTAVAPFIYPLF